MLMDSKCDEVILTFNNRIKKVFNLHVRPLLPVALKTVLISHVLCSSAFP